MVYKKLDKATAWSIKIKSGSNMSDEEKDFIADLVSEEARKTTKSYYFILHDIVEREKYSELLLEGTEIAIKNLVSVARDNLPHKIIYRRHML